MEATTEEHMDRFAWLASLKCNQFYLTKNSEHAPNYMTAKDWIEESPEDFSNTDPSEIQKMKDTNTIWCLQIYPITPIGFHSWYGASAEFVIDEAMRGMAG